MRKHYTLCKHVDPIPPSEPCAVARAKIDANAVLREDHRCPDNNLRQLPRAEDGMSADCPRCAYDKAIIAAYDKMGAGPVLQEAAALGKQKAPVRPIVAGPAAAVIEAADAYEEEEHSDALSEASLQPELTDAEKEQRFRESRHLPRRANMPRNEFETDPETLADIARVEEFARELRRQRRAVPPLDLNPRLAEAEEDYVVRVMREYGFDRIRAVFEFHRRAWVLST